MGTNARSLSLLWIILITDALRSPCSTSQEFLSLLALLDHLDFLSYLFPLLPSQKKKKVTGLFKLFASGKGSFNSADRHQSKCSPAP